MLQGIFLISLITLWPETNSTRLAEELRGSWAVIAEKACVAPARRTVGYEGMLAWERGKGPTLVIADNTLTLAWGKNKAVYAIRASTKSGEYHLTLREGVGKCAQDLAPPKLTCSLDGDLLKVRRLPDGDDARKSREDDRGFIPGLPPYQVITVHPYWKHVQFLAKRSK
jgi:hypothetical protein